MNLACTVCGADLSGQHYSAVQKHVASHRTKVSVEEKMAELEARIVELEKELGLHTGFAPRIYASMDKENPVTWTDTPHWKKMWFHFGKFFDRFDNLFR